MSIKIPYDKCKSLIKEADLLLFHHGEFPSVGWWIGKYTRSMYSHAGLAHWDNNEIYVLEFKEFTGSRKYLLNDYIKDDVKIDVFRACSDISYPRIRKIDNSYVQTFDHFTVNDSTRKSITESALELIGETYSYWIIWQILKTYIPFIRLNTRGIKSTKETIESFVCSTLVTYSYRVNFIDPVPFLDDNYTTPGDLARSSIFTKLFEIT